MSIAEMELGNNRAVVAPRVTCGNEEGRLVDRVESMLRRGIRGTFNLCGPAGSGKTTALRELTRAFADRVELRVVDERASTQTNWPSRELVIFASTQPSLGNGGMRLAPWGRDEWIEYMLARWRGRCSSVMGRVLKDSFADRLDGNAQLWAAVLDEMAVGGDFLDIRAALRKRVARVAPSAQQHAAAAGLCVQLLTHQISESGFGLPFLAHPDFSRLLRHRAVRLLLASDMLVHWLCDVGDASMLGGRWPAELVAQTARQLAQRNGAAAILESTLENGEPRLHPISASLLLALEPLWRPPARYVPNLTGAQLKKAQWVHVDLFGASLVNCDLRMADLRSARLQNAKAASVKLGQARLEDALMQGIDAEGGDFSQAKLGRVNAEGGNFAHANFQNAILRYASLAKANLVGANLREARFKGAILRRARLNNAELEGADFSNADLTKAEFGNAVLIWTFLRGACLRKAMLRGSNLEMMDLAGTDLRGADLSKCLLTGARAAGGKFRKADLREAGLAEIDLEGADLRGADLRGSSFHLGSTRSGLVGSVIPCEGSKTGFYTDEREEQSYRRPEEIRKANLSFADLRGAKIKGVDFYLVDVRGATYTSRQGKYLKRCGAIMG